MLKFRYLGTAVLLAPLWSAAVYASPAMSVTDTTDAAVTGTAHTAAASRNGKKAKRDASVKKAKDKSSYSLETVKVIAPHETIMRKHDAPVLVDSVIYDDLNTPAARDSMAEILLQVPGVSGIEDGDEARYVSIRGIQPDLNSTLMDGLPLASVGQTGSGSREVDLQMIPSDIGTRTDVSKSFSAEQESDAIGGSINIVTRSAFDHKGAYWFGDLMGIYSSKNNISTYGNYTGHTRPHFGDGAKFVFSDTFGPDHQFGIVVAARGESRERNSTKRWNPTQLFYGTNGKLLSQYNPVGQPNWNGMIAPYDYSNASYTNQITNYGGSIKLEWQPKALPFYASLLGYSYRRYESSTMNKFDLYTNTSYIANQTPDGGQQLINSIYLKNRYDRWDMHNRGLQGVFRWDVGERSSLSLRAGRSYENFVNNEPYFGARAYPSNLYVNYQYQDTYPYLTSFSNPSLLQNSAYKMYEAQYTKDAAYAAMNTVKLDYAFNVDADAHGFGMAAGVEYRHLKNAKNEDMTVYKASGSAAPYLFYPGQPIEGSSYALPWVNAPLVAGQYVPGLKVDGPTSAYDSQISDFRYDEYVRDAYVSFHYALPSTLIILGDRFDMASYGSGAPQVVNNVLQGSWATNRGHYSKFLPSLNVVQRLPWGVTGRFSASKTVGRPTPSYIASAQEIDCSEDQGGGPGECSISKGNPDLKPRISTNYDLDFEKYFNGYNGVVSLELYQKNIKNNIFNLSSVQEINGTMYNVSEPMNAQSSRLRGITISGEYRNIHIGNQTFDSDISATRLYGRMDFETSRGMRSLDRLLYEPDWSATADWSWRVPHIHGRLTFETTYRSNMVNYLGTTAWTDQGYGSLVRTNLYFRHEVGRHWMFKYELANLINSQPHYLSGPQLRYVNEIDNYGRAVYFHVIYN